MNVLVSGASGLVGSALVEELEKRGDRVFKLVRGRSDKEREVSWNVESGEIETAKLRGADAPDAVVHLAGESIASGRWTEEQMRKIKESRVGATEKLAGSLLRLEKLPKVFVSASAIGFYGDRGDELLEENSRAGEGFLTDVVIGWERAAESLKAGGVRVAHARFGLILSGKGGALPKMMLPFRMGIGGKIGDGCQWMSWVAKEDVVRALLFVLGREDLSGAFNVVSPAPVRNEEWTKVLAKVLHRPSLVPEPAFALRLALGEMADALMLASQRVVPKRLLDAGFVFEHPDLEGALRAELDR